MDLTVNVPPLTLDTLDLKIEMKVIICVNFDLK